MAMSGWRDMLRHESFQHRALQPAADSLPCYSGPGMLRRFQGLMTHNKRVT